MIENLSDIDITTTVLAAFKYGNTITPNVLELLARGWPLYVTILLVTLQLCLSNAVGSSALFQHIEEIFDAERGKNLNLFILNLVN